MLAWCESGLLARQVKETGEKMDKNDGNPWAELLVSINDLLHNRSRPVSHNGEISAAKMERWCGKTWLEFAPWRGRATARRGRTKNLSLAWALPADTADMMRSLHADIQKTSLALLLVIHRGLSAFPAVIA